MVKSSIHKALRFIGYDIISLDIEQPISPFDILDFIVGNYVLKGVPFNFIQIGAHDGVRNDPIRPLVIKYGLPGVLVEPLPDFYSELCKNYANYTGLDFECSAVSNKEGAFTLYRFRRDAPVPKTFFHGLARNDKEYIAQRAKESSLEEYVEEVTVDYISFDRLLRKHQINRVGLLQIDTEGHDFDVIQSVMDSAIRPLFINYEWTELRPRDRVACKKLLLSNDYSFVDVGADVLCKHASVIN